MNPIWEALGGVGNVLDMPGSYLRGALAGRPGERASGRDLLSSYGLTDESDPWGGLKGFGAEMVLDPLALAGPAVGAWKGARGLTRGAEALSHADGANPLVRGLAGFLGDEGGYVDLARAAEMVRSGEGPLGRFARLADTSPAVLDVGEDLQKKIYNYPHGNNYNYLDVAAYLPADMYSLRTRVPRMMPNLLMNAWNDEDSMKNLVRYSLSDTPTVPESAFLDKVPVHEVGHAFHHNFLDWPFKLSHGKEPMISKWDIIPPWAGRSQAYPTMMGWKMPPSLRADIERGLGRYATKDPLEYVAEGFTRQVLGEPLPATLQELYQQMHGPDLDELPAAFWDVLRQQR